MTVDFRSSFARDLKTIREADLRDRIQAVIQGVEQAGLMNDIPNLIKLKGGGNYYRIRVGDYRIGLIITGNIASFVRCLDRSEIYKSFP